MPRAPVLRDPERDDALQQVGYAIVPVLDRDAADDLRRAYHDALPGGSSGMFVEYMQDDRERMAAVDRLLEPVWSRHLDEVFVDHRVVFSTFVVKYPGPGSSMFLHDDRTFVDERRHRAFTLWIPLVDASPELGNGGLQVVPGSPRLALTMAGSHTPELFRPYERALTDALVDVPMRAGDGLVYDCRTLHSSPPNRTDRPREAIACAVVPREADLVHVVGTGARRRRLLAVDDAFYRQLSPPAIERSLGAGYDVVEEYDDDVVALSPELVGEVIGSVTVAPDPVVPPDLVDLLEGRVVRPEVGRRRRVGALVTVPGQEVLAGRPAVGHAEPPPIEDWVPAAMLTGTTAGWLVGDPQVALGDGCWWIRLVPGERLGLPFPTGAVVRTADAAPLGAGILAPGRLAPLVTGTEVRVEGPGPMVVWNHGPGDLVVAAETTVPARRWWSRRGGRRGEARLLDEVKTALDLRRSEARPAT